MLNADKAIRSGPLCKSAIFLRTALSAFSETPLPTSSFTVLRPRAFTPILRHTFEPGFLYLEGRHIFNQLVKDLC